MPKLNGKPRKSVLYAKVRESSSENRRLSSEIFQLRRRLGSEIEHREKAEQALSELRRNLSVLAAEAKSLSGRAMLAGLPGARLRA
jgi:regulator of replication initiation timing